MTDIPLLAEDGFELPAMLALPEVSNGIAVQINPAAITPMRYYRPFAEHLAARGFTVLLFEVRGLLLKKGESARRSPASLLKWGRLDHTAATRYLRTHYPQHALAVIGHSMGGQLVGLSPLAGEAHAVLLVASAHGYWRRRPGSTLSRLRRVTMARAVAPLTIAALGYMPSFVLGGEPKPADYARELARFVCSPHFFCDERGRPLRPHHADIRAPLRHIVITDDERVPPGSELDTPTRYPNARTERLVLTPADYGLEKIGHHGLFHRSMPRRAWDDMARWLESAVQESAARHATLAEPA